MEIIDLSFPIHNGMSTYPAYWHPLAEINQLGRIPIEGRESRKLLLGTHTGTHVDAPSHFIENGMSIDKVSLETFVGDALIISLDDSLILEEISLKKIEQKINNRFAERLILRYGWSKYWGSLNYYQNHPHLSKEAARFLVESGFKLIGMDTPQADNPKNCKGSKEDSPIHKILLGAGIIKLEYMNNLDLLEEGFFKLISLPLNILGADGSPVRCVGIQNG